MSTYVMSDIHGQYRAYRQMLKTIGFTNEDTLYVLGDVIDRGSEGINILLDMMNYSNIVFLLGNHELLMLDALRNVRELIEKDRHDTDDLDLWQDPCNGGSVTYSAYCDLPSAKQAEVVQYLKDAWAIIRIKIGRNTYHLSHAYTCERKIGDGLKFSELNRKEIWNVVWQSIYDRKFYRDKGDYLFPSKKSIYIAGHTFTQRLDCLDKEGRGIIYHATNYRGFEVYNIDCGMALKNRSSQLACLRLEDCEEYYVPLN